ncbi:MAG TPA: exonuclease domain-containing protein [Bacteroidota bacterium]|nr:exonuclease domain-containing protein [Bacteroidota bacterium]
MPLTLNRPLVFFDLETTGTDVARDRIVQISALKLHPGGREEVKTRLINPGTPIPAAATAIHHIADADVAAEPKFRDIARGMAEFFHDSDIAGFNSNRFDIPILVEEFGRSGIAFPEPGTKLIDVQVIYHRKEERTLAAAYKFYCSKNLSGAHDAEADVRATMEVFREQLERYDDIGTTIDDLHRYSNSDMIVDYARKLVRNERGEIVYAFGKNRGKPVLDDPGYAEWMLAGDFPESTKNVLRQILAKSGG